jgi:uncharacterized protein
MSSERAIVFACGGEELLGILHTPDESPRETSVLVVVGGPQYRVGSHRQFVLMARQLARAGYRVLRFDYRGMGDSSGERRNFESVDADIRAALDVLASEEPTPRRLVIFGLCDAASALLMYCRQDTRLNGLILANPWVHSETLAAQTVINHYYGRRFLQKSFWAKVFAGQFNVFNSIRGLLGSVSAARGVKSAGGGVTFIDRMLEGLRAFRAPVLIQLSDHDLTAREFGELVRRSPPWSSCVAGANVDVFAVCNADHTFSWTGSLDTAVRQVLDWLARLDAEPTQVPRLTPNANTLHTAKSQN